MIEQARENTVKVSDILALYEQMKSQVREVTHSQYSIAILDAIFARPVFLTSDIAERTGLSRQTVMPLLRQLKEAGVLTTVRPAQGRRPARLAFPSLLNMAEGRDVF
ncbi:MAG: MarR family transcriptional regulator [Alphaproteobacteria bacterium]